MLHVKPMSSHQLRAGTTKWASTSPPRTRTPSSTSSSRRSPQHAHSEETLPSPCSAPGMPSESQAQVPVYVRPPAKTRCGVGAKQNGFAIQMSVEAGNSTSACASWRRLNAAAASPAAIPNASDTSATLGGRPVATTVK